jgi:tetratricopeptide (TPR) repeat protein
MNTNTPEKPPEPISTSPSQESKKGFNIVLQKIRDVPYLANIVTIMVPLFAGFLAAWLWFESTLSERVEQRIAPYEYFLNGSALVQDGEYDRAIPELERAFTLLGRSFDQRSSSGENWYPVVDNYLQAITNSEDPSDHTHRFNRLMRLVTDDKISLTAWQRHLIGWYYLRTGDVQKARESLSKALESYRVEQKYNTSSDTYWTLALTDLAEGNVESAINNITEAGRRNNRLYDLETVISDVKSMREESWSQRLIRLYPKFDSSLPAFLQQLEQLKSQRDTTQN